MNFALSLEGIEEVSNQAEDRPSSSSFCSDISQSAPSDSEQETNMLETRSTSCKKKTTSQTTISNDRDLEADNPVDELTDDKETTNKIRRKGKATPNSLKRLQAKILRNQGKSYVSERNKLVPERRLKSPCGDQCRLKCKENITELQRQKLFQNYWEIGDLKRQREYIKQHISEIKPKYSYKIHNSNRGNKFAFYFSVANKKSRVCKTFFKATLDITDRPIRTVIQKTKDTGNLEDRRGRHKKPRL
ncbi:uncharacterized protein LOC114355146 isoform X5 [Ostrinia furnacalis]|uniref:uncharacterized protein LOC114355146 isoform X5 n=1 Tax=Ostrinia furnacalis TaxID=93504 RepID=UPI001039EE6E|nr:uncharacterized protein LOC114355146 isoform X5 [Ostrinia furnacalis]